MRLMCGSASVLDRPAIPPRPPTRCAHYRNNARSAVARRAAREFRRRAPQVGALPEWL